MAELGAGSGTSYPASLDVDNTVEVDASTKVRADVPNDLAAAIIAVQAELGTNPAGSITDVKTFLQTEHSTDGTHANLTADNITISGELIQKVGSDVASASDLDITPAGNFFDVTGTTTIATMKSKGVGTQVTLQFDGACQLTHDATNFDLPGGANITTAAGDQFTFYEYATADWRCIGYALASGRAIIFDHKMKVSSDDTTANYLVSKLTGGDGITATETSGGGNETLDIKITDGAVDSAMLKTTTEEESVTYSGAPQTLTFGSSTSYGFFPQSKVNASSKWFNTGANPGASMPTTYATVIEVSTNINPMTAYMQIRYVQASPPYDLGDGEVNAFIYAVIENGTGDIKRMHSSQDPPWIYHPIHGINRDNVFRDVETKKKKIKIRGKVNLDTIRSLTEFENSQSEVIVDFDNTVKMSAMNNFPHPYVDIVFNKLNDIGETVVDTDYWKNHHVALIDPMSDTVKRLDEMRADGDESLSLFHDGYLKIDNVDIANRKRPNGVAIYAPSWKN